MQNSNYLLLTYPDFLNYVLKLCLEIRKNNRIQPIDYIISVQRGGAVMSKIISDIFDIPIRCLTVKGYKKKIRSTDTKLTEPLSQNIKGKTVIVLDEISDTGKTLAFVKKYIKGKSPKNIIFATIFIKPWTTFVPDIYIKKTNKWIVFPYELKEMYDLVQDEDKLSMEKMYIKYMLENGVTKNTLKKLFE
ncbi:MAG: hypothetical protein GX435_07450 [Exilispira sp.]|nr:hypothetical protein [Exilispira sp.]